ncbi:MAG TPA: IS1380 family transposase, partial [Actinomycetes bacterium]|nr:IS1380 family transposase [Actinomycetes bacterium]
GVVSHAGSRLLADLAVVTGLTSAYSEAMAGARDRLAGHDPGRVLADLAVTIAGGGECISDLAVLRDQPRLFGRVASTATAWRVLDGVDDSLLAGLRAARAAARERAWAQREETGRPLPAARAGGRELPGLVVDVDATLVTAHSEKEQATPTFKGGFGFHPILAYLDNTNEALAGVLRPGKAGANTAADHIAVTDLALAQIPDAVRHGTPILLRTDGAGCTKAWLTHLRRLREEHALQVEFSVGFPMTEPVQQAILGLPEAAWTPAVEADGEIRDGADVAELTGVLPRRLLAEYPAGMRVIVRRERPHPGAQLRFTDVDGWRFQAFATDTPRGQLAHLEARHRAHARVEDRIRCGKDTGIGRFPSRQYPINAVWLELSLAAADLLAWAQTTLLDGDLARAEPKTLRYRLLHVAARLTRGQRRTFLRIDAHWPWRHALAAAFARLQALPLPIT